jgi:glycosyltransferase involved in cell wall biosynthesis
VPEPLVTVAMSVHNAASTLEAALRSILWQTFSDWELILVDDGSTDQTGRLLSQFGDVRIHVVEGKGGQRGLATRLNECIDLARGKYVARMDADDIAYPERFERQVQYLETHPEVDLLGHGAVLFKGDGQALGAYPAASEHEEICRRPWWGFPLAHPTWMGRRAWFAKHRYNNDLTKGQDQELLLRSYRASRFAALPDVLLGYRAEQVSARKTARGRYYYCKTLVSHIHDTTSAVMAGRGIVVHALGFCRDVAGELVGANTRVFQRLGGAPDAAMLARWGMIWSDLKKER